MATLNATNFDSAEDIENDVVKELMAHSRLTWHWQTWPKNLRKSVGITGVIFVLVGAATFWFNQLDTELSQKSDQQNSIKAQAQTKLRESGQERDLIVKYLPLLHELELRNIFGEEKRLEWVEQLRIIEKRWPGVAIKYDIAAQEILPPPKTPGAPNYTPSAPPLGATLPNGEPVKYFAVFNTKMKLTLQVLHEGDVLAILSELKDANLGFFTVKRCHFSRPGGSDIGNSDSGFGAPLTVECDLVWISMRTYKDKI